MKKTAVAVAVAASALGMSQFAAADFVKDSKLSLDLRNYYFAHEDDMQLDANDKDYGQWGQAFMLNYKSGFTDGVVGFGVDLSGMAGYRLADHSSKNDVTGNRTAQTQLFPVDAGEVDSSRLSKSYATVKARVGQTELHVGGLRPNTPVLVANDARLLPQVYEGAQITSKDVQGLTLTAAQLWKHYGRAALQWDNVGPDQDPTQAGNQQDRFNIYGLEYKVFDGLTAQYYQGKLDGWYKQHFGGLKYASSLGAGKFSADLRYFDTGADAQGAEASFNNSLWSTLFNYSISGHTFGLGYQALNGRTGFNQLTNAGDYQGGASTYVITERMIERMTNKEETVMLASYGFDFGAVGVKGLNASVIYQKGEWEGTAWDGVSKKDLSETETDVVIGYTVPDGQLKGLGVRVMQAMYKGDVDTAAGGENEKDQTRVIVSYSIPLM